MSGGGLRDKLAGLLEHAIYEAARDSVEPGTEGLILADAVLPEVHAHLDAAVARAEAAEQAVQRVRGLHRVYRIFDECGHQHEYAEDGNPPEGVVEVEEVGLTCNDGYMYSICFECCTGGSGFQTEECVESHHHGLDVIHCGTIRVLDNELAVSP